MAEGLNRVMLLGNLGADPELKMTTGGQSVLRLRLATTETYLDRNKVRQEKTEWHTVTLWGKRAEALHKILAKGDRIFVEGSLQTRSWEKNGEKRYATDVNAQNVILGGGGRGRGEQREEGGYQPRSEPRPPQRAPAPAPAAPAPAPASDSPDEAPYADFAGGPFDDGDPGNHFPF